MFEICLTHKTCHKQTSSTELFTRHVQPVLTRTCLNAILLRRAQMSQNQKKLPHSMLASVVLLRANCSQASHISELFCLTCQGYETNIRKTIHANLFHHVRLHVRLRFQMMHTKPAFFLSSGKKTSEQRGPIQGQFFDISC